jgi:hypothetical protein
VRADEFEPKAESNLATLVHEFAAELGAAIQAIEAARPALVNEEMADWLSGCGAGMVAESLRRAATVAANMALMRIWAPSKGAFRFEKLNSAFGKAATLSQQQVSNVRAALKEDPETTAAIKKLTRWRNKRIAHRESSYIMAGVPDGGWATQEEFDRVVDHSLAILRALRKLLPKAAIPELECMKQNWSKQAQEFWRMLQPLIPPNSAK